MNTQDMDGVTSLMIASSHGHPETVRVLLDYGADANMLAWDKESYQTALILACFTQRTVCVALLLDGGADPNLCDSTDSPLSAACHVTGHYQPMDPTILEKLLSAGGNPNTLTGQYGTTTLMVAADQGYVKGLQVLLNASADVNIQNSYGTTALMLAADRGYNKGVQVLLNASADINIQNSLGDTALHCAADNDHLGICKMLLASGARASLTNSDGNTPLDLAQHKRHFKVCKLLRSIMDSTATQDKISKPVQNSSQPDGDIPLDDAQNNVPQEVCELFHTIMDSTATQDKITSPVQDSSQPHKPSRLLSSIKPRRGILPSISSIRRQITDLLFADRAIKNQHNNQQQEPTTTND